MCVNPLVSVVIPVYNGQNHISQCLEMILNQSYKNLEVIVVDDGSTDNSVQLINKFTKVRLIQHSVNKGLSAARNTGINNATGKYIHFMDDDDQINVEFYESFIEACEKNNADMACGSFMNASSPAESQIFTSEKVVTSVKDKYTATYVVRKAYVWRYFFSLNFIREHQLYFEEGRLMEDILFSSRAVYYANKVVIVPNAHYHYVSTPNSIMNNKDKKHMKRREADYQHALKMVEDFAEEHHFKVPALNTGKLQYKCSQVAFGLKYFLKTFNFAYLKF